MTDARSETGEVKALPVDPALLEAQRRLASAVRTAWLAAAGASALAAGIAFGTVWLLLDPPAIRMQLSELDARLAAQETALEKIGDRIAALETKPDAAADLRLELAEIRTRLEGPARDLRDVARRVEALEGRLDRMIEDNRGLTDEIRSMGASGTELTAALEAQRAEGGRILDRLRALENRPYRAPEALVATLLVARAAERSEPFPEQMRAFLATSEEPPDPVLKTAAAAGVPTSWELIGRLPSAVRAAIRAAATEDGDAEGSAPEAGALDDAYRWFRGLVTLERAGDATEDGPLRDLVRFGSEARGGDLQTALDLIATLPEPVRAGLDDWSEAARLRVRLDREIDRLLDQALAGIE